MAHVVAVSAMGTLSPDENGSLEHVGKAIGLEYRLLHEGKIFRTYSTFLAGFDAVYAAPRADESYAGVSYTHYLTGRLAQKPLAPYARVGLGLIGRVGGEMPADDEPDVLTWHAAGGVHGFARRVYWAAELGYEGGPIGGMRGRAALGYLIAQQPW